MRKELEEKLVKRFPTWFDVNGDAHLSAVPCGFGHGDGWFNILWRLCVDLEPLVEEVEQVTGERFEVVQVREKLGTFRIYVSHHSDAINERIVAAQKEASHTCELCGQPGKYMNKDGRVQARCYEHA